MKDIFGILELTNPQSFTLDIEPVKDNVGIRRIVNAGIRQLEDIERSFLVDSGRPEFSQLDIDKILEKVKSNAGKKSKIDWSFRELKLLSYYIMRFIGAPDQFRYAMRTITDNWRDSFFNGLVYSLLSGWTVCNSELRSTFIGMLKDRLHAYQGSFPKYQKLKEHSDFLDGVGPNRICALLLAKNIELDEAPSFLGLTAPNLRLPYFSDVIISYIKNRKSNLDEIKLILEKHTLDRTKKLVLAHLIEEADNSGDSMQQTMLCRRAREIMNYDVTLESTWGPFSGASEEEKNTLKHCHELVTAWYAKRSVETFFEIACQDKDRRNFWLKYVYAIHNFKIVGSESVRTMLRRDGRITDALRSCFIESKSRSSQTSALVLYIKNKIFVEFSDTGALYVYNPDRKVIVPLKTIKSIERAEDLKQPSIGALVQQDTNWYGTKWWTHYEEGRLPHSGYWQERLDDWMRRVLEIQPKNNYKSNTKTKQAPITKKQVTEKPYRQPSLFETSDKNKNNTQQTEHSTSPNLPTYWYLNVLFSSKEFLPCKIRIVATEKGYCINIVKTNIFIQIEPTLRRASGSIWIKKADGNGYRMIVHVAGDFQYIVGYIKNDSNRLLFKKKIDLKPQIIQL